jgi:predicted AAA+ superfamily ATPase
MNQELTNPTLARLLRKVADSLTIALPEATPRHIRGRIEFPGKATAVIGMRRAGKTTFLHQLRGDRLAKGIAREQVLYFNFEDEQLAGLEGRHLHVIVEEYYRRFPQTRGQHTVSWFFDEIQTVPGWERFVRRLLDSEKAEVFISGSSAALLSREIATSMRGRAWEVVVHPFSFEEYLRHHRLEVPERPDFLDAPQRSTLERAFVNYLGRGGFPEAQNLDTATHHILLRDYVDVAMLRDIVERHGVTNVVGLRWLVRQLLGNAGSLFSAQKFFAALKSEGVVISKDTVHALLSHLEDCFLVRTVWLESSSERQRMVNPRKAFPVDPGLIPVFDRTGRPNTGHALETAVLLELERRRMSVTYVRTESGREVDFLARGPAGEMELIQVCADARGAETLARELRALEEAGKQHPRAVKRLLTLTRDALPAALPKDVVLQTGYEWMLT